MLLNRSQLIVIALSVLLFVILIFGCDTTPPEIRGKEKSMSQTIEATSVQNILKQAQSKMSREELAVIDLLNKELNETPDSLQKDKLIALSSKWYEMGNAAMAGHYAQKVAELDNQEQSWAVSGTTYTLCLKSTEDPKIKDFCTGRAMKSFENALSLNPENVEHRINMALVKVENPPNGQPMTGILELIELNKSYPNNVSIMNQLARLAIRTNQIDKAIARLNTAIAIEPDNTTTNCLLAEALTLAGKESEGEKYKEKCLNNR